MSSSFSVQFIGATGTVTGSKYLVRYGNHRLLIDCGLFQGIKNVRRRNWAELPFQPSELDAVLLTHAHIDHSGYLPALMKQGYHKNIHCSEGTKALCKVLLPDAGYLQEEDAKYANKKKFSRHQPAEPLYTEEDARKVLRQFKAQAFAEPLQLPGGITAEFFPVGHILGASAIRLTYQGKRIIFSGDVGRSDDLIMYPPKPLPETDYLVVESTYGDRRHEDGRRAPSHRRYYQSHGCPRRHCVDASVCRRPGANGAAHFGPATPAAAHSHHADLPEQPHGHSRHRDLF